MSSILNLRLAAIMSSLALTLSGGCGGPTVDPWVAPPADYYKRLDSTANATSTFGGVGIRNSEEVVQASGALVHNTGALTYDDGFYNLDAPAGFDDTGTASGVEGSIVDMSDTYAGTYEYVMPVVFNYKVDEVSYTTIGFAGITTDADHVPVNGSATYTGDAAGIISASSIFDLTGVSTIFVDFGASSVDVTLNLPSVVITGDAEIAPLDAIVITGMTIAGNQFTGGALEALLDNVTVNIADIIGANVTESSEGMFFGWDNANLIPSEVGGVSLIMGDTGVMQFLFVGVNSP